MSDQTVNVVISLEEFVAAIIQQMVGYGNIWTSKEFVSQFQLQYKNIPKKTKPRAPRAKVANVSETVVVKEEEEDAVSHVAEAGSDAVVLVAATTKPKRKSAKAKTVVVKEEEAAAAEDSVAPQEPQESVEPQEPVEPVVVAKKKKRTTSKKDAAVVGDSVADSNKDSGVDHITKSLDNLVLSDDAPVTTPHKPVTTKKRSSEKKTKLAVKDELAKLAVAVEPHVAPEDVVHHIVVVE